MENENILKNGIVKTSLQNILKTFQKKLWTLTSGITTLLITQYTDTEINGIKVGKSSEH